MSQFGSRNIRVGIDVEAEKAERQLYRLAQAQIRFQKSMGDFVEAQKTAITASTQFAHAMDEEGRSMDSYIRHLRLLTEAAVASAAARTKAAREASEAEQLAMMMAEQRAQVAGRAAARELAARLAANREMLLEIEKRGAAEEESLTLERMIAQQRAEVQQRAAMREAEIRAESRRAMMNDIEIRGREMEKQVQLERMMAEQRALIQANAARRAQEAAAIERRAMMLDIEARGGAGGGGLFPPTTAQGPGWFGAAAGQLGQILRTSSRILATFFLWQFAIRQVGSAIDGLFLRPVREVATAVLEASDAFRKVEVSLLGIVGSMRAVKELRKDVTIAAAGLPITTLQALEAARAISYIPATAQTVQNPNNRPENLKQLFTILQGLSVINPRQGLPGAEFSLREALAGQFRSLRFRFDISPQVVAQAIGKSLQDLQANPQLVIEALDKFVQTFVGPEAIDEMQRILSVQGTLFKGVMQEFFALVGDQGIYDTVTSKLSRLVRAARAGLTPDATGQIALEPAAKLLNQSLERLLNQILTAAGSTASGLLGHPVDLARAIDKGDITELVNVGAELIDELRKVGGVMLLALGDLGKFFGGAGRALGIFGDFDPDVLRKRIAEVDSNPGIQAYKNYQATLAQKAEVDARIEQLNPIADNPDLQQLDARIAAMRERQALYTRRHKLTAAQRSWYEQFELGIGGDSGDSGDFLGRLYDLQTRRSEDAKRLAFLEPGGDPNSPPHQARALMQRLAQMWGDPDAALRVSGQATRASLTSLLLSTRETDIGASGGTGGIPAAFQGENSLSGRLGAMAANWADQMNPQREGSFAANIKGMQDAVALLEKVNAGEDPDHLLSQLREIQSRLDPEDRADVEKAIAGVPAAVARLKLHVANELGVMNESLEDAISTLIRSSVQGFQGLAPESIIRQSNSLIGSGIRGQGGGPLDVMQLRTTLQAAAALNGMQLNAGGLNPDDTPAYIQAILGRTTALGGRTRHYDDSDRRALQAARGDLGLLQSQLEAQLPEASESGKERVLQAIDAVKQASRDLADNFDQDIQRMRQATDEWADGMEGSFRTAFGDVLVHIVDDSANKVEDIFRNLGRSITQVTADTISSIATYWARQGLMSLLGAGAGAGGAGAPQSNIVYAEGGMAVGPWSQVPGMAEGELFSRTQGLFSDPYGRRFRTVESGQPEAMIPLRGGGVPVMFRGWHGQNQQAPQSVTIINVVDSADMLRRGAARAPDAIVNPVVADATGRGRVRKVMQLSSRR